MTILKHSKYLSPARLKDPVMRSSRTSALPLSLFSFSDKSQPGAGFPHGIFTHLTFSESFHCRQHLLSLPAIFLQFMMRLQQESPIRQLFARWSVLASYSSHCSRLGLQKLKSSGLKILAHVNQKMQRSFRVVSS